MIITRSMLKKRGLTKKCTNSANFITIIPSIILLSLLKPKKRVIFNAKDIKNWIKKEKKEGTSNNEMIKIISNNTGWSKEEILDVFSELKKKYTITPQNENHTKKMDKKLNLKKSKEFNSLSKKKVVEEPDKEKKPGFLGRLFGQKTEEEKRKEEEKVAKENKAEKLKELKEERLKQEKKAKEERLEREQNRLKKLNKIKQERLEKEKVAKENKAEKLKELKEDKLKQEKKAKLEEKSIKISKLNKPQLPEKEVKKPGFFGILFGKKKSSITKKGSKRKKIKVMKKKAVKKRKLVKQVRKKLVKERKKILKKAIKEQKRLKHPAKIKKHQLPKKEPSHPGFFSRIFGKKSTTPPKKEKSYKKIPPRSSSSNSSKSKNSKLQKRLNKLKTRLLEQQHDAEKERKKLEKKRKISKSKDIKKRKIEKVKEKSIKKKKQGILKRLLSKNKSLKKKIIKAKKASKVEIKPSTETKKQPLLKKSEEIKKPSDEGGVQHFLEVMHLKKTTPHDEGPDKISLKSTAINKLKNISSPTFKGDKLEETSWIFNIFIKNFYGIPGEKTKEELVKIISDKKMNDAKKHEIVYILENLDLLKYASSSPTETEVKTILEKISKFISSA